VANRGANLGHMPHRCQAVEPRHQGVVERRRHREWRQCAVEHVAIPFFAVSQLQTWCLTTTNTDFVFLNPTGLTLTLEYAFRQPARRVNCAADLQKTWFALNSLVEEDGFGPSIPREHDQR
jgi:hypothetical protein